MCNSYFIGQIALDGLELAYGCQKRKEVRAKLALSMWVIDTGTYLAYLAIASSPVSVCYRIQGQELFRVGADGKPRLVPKPPQRVNLI